MESPITKNKQKMVAKKKLLDIANSYEPVRRTRLHGVYFFDGMAIWRSLSDNYSVPIN